MSYIELKHCVACGSGELITTLDLGDQPLANSYTKSKDEVLEEFPLAINRCSNCCHVQLSVAVDPDLMFKNYLYVSGTSKTLRDYFTWFARYTKEYHELAFLKNDDVLSVLDIGCNDGSMLDQYKELGLSTQGIDPAENLFIESSKRHDIICDYFGPGVVDKLTVPDIITAQNVFAHNHDPLAFMQSLKSIMSDSTLCFIQTSQANMILNNEYDTIYHEHISFYNIKSMKLLCERAGLHLIDVTKSPIHGTSYIFVVSNNEKIAREANIENLIKNEENNGLYSSGTYEVYENNCINSVYDISSTVEFYRNNGYRIIGYGAAAKGNTLLNFAKVELDYIIDDNPLKHGYYTPGMQIEIVSKDILDDYSEEDRILFIPLAWNFFTEIRSNIKKKRDNTDDAFLMYFPDVKVID